MSQCRYWSNCGMSAGGCCSNEDANEKYGKRVSPGVCKICPFYVGPSRGRGDRIDKVLTTVTLGGSKIIKRRCGGCQKRQQEENRKHPAKK